MVKVRENLADRGCRKLRCRTGSCTLHRHHLRHQAMWLGVWRGRRYREKRWHEFVRAYYEFRAQDIVYLCDWHHAEIHKLYDELIQRDKAKVGKPLYRYSWKQAERLMRTLENACLDWLKTESPGIEPRHLNELRSQDSPTELRPYEADKRTV